MTETVIPPGSTIGILGGGQLGKMLAVAATQLGYRCHIYAPEQDSIAAEVSAECTTGDWSESDALAAFASRCDVVTYEFENVPVAALASLGGARVLPGSRALEVAQDRLTEKQFVVSLGAMPAPFQPFDDGAGLDAAVERIGVPGIVKTRRDGYDGKGQWRVMDDADVAGIPVDGRPLIYEGFVRFFAEFSVILCRGTDGQIVVWDSTENVHRDGILRTSTLPIPAALAAQVPAARALAEQVANALEYVGVLTLEFFATDDGPVFNEMAPRVHNSGHWSIEGAATSQFENHIRAITGLPLGSTKRRSEHVAMRNLIGDDVLDWPAVLADPTSHLHLYGKGDARPGRKMGHVTTLS